MPSRGVPQRPEIAPIDNTEGRPAERGVPSTVLADDLEQRLELDRLGERGNDAR